MNLSRSKVAQLDSTIQSFKQFQPFVNQAPQSRPKLDPFSRKEFIPHPHHIHKTTVRPPPHGAIKSTHLPVYSHYTEILKAISENQVSIISGGTGTGKTTQVPQYIIADFLNKPRGSAAVPNVIVTQPRRIAAVSVAQRVAAERNETIGKNSAVGYNVRFETMPPTVPASEGRVTFCTTGVLLRRLQEDRKLEGITHILLDEVHERDMNTDFLLMVLRELLEERPDLKLVLMSATAEINLFQNYFRHYGSIGKLSLPQVIEIPGRTFPIKEYYLNDYYDSLSQYSYPLMNSRETKNYISNELKGRSYDDCDLPLDLIETLISHISLTKGPGAVLCFLPGWEEMSKLQRHMLERDIMRVGYKDKSKFKIICLHSSIPIAMQQEAFKKVPPGVRKIVLATNIAETSVTIDDIVYVVDTAKVKEKVFDPSRRITSLSPIFTSQANIRQRTGRAGRCQPGQYFSLITRSHKYALPRAQVPELLRSDLRSICLHIRAMGFSGPLGAILAKAPNPPRHQSIHMAIDNLKSLDALNDEQNLTPLGSVLASLPIDPGFGKMVVLGCIFKCLDPILTVAAALGSKDVFTAPPDLRDKLKRVRRKWAQGSECDALTTVNVVREWEKIRHDKHEENDFCERNFIHRIGIRTIHKTKLQLKDILQKAGFMAHSAATPDEDLLRERLVGGSAMNINSNNQGLIRALLTAGMYPNIAE
ncbi:P-loop containing nucleoside triphosphate hydrolase protein, partial [Basidiobolus meristosporus CBS 931.73]